MYPGNWAKADPSKIAVVMAESGDSLTYRELNERSAQLAHYLRRCGMATGSHVAILMGNSLDSFIAFWAAQRSGLFYTPINWHLTPREIAHILEDSGSRMLITDSSHEETAHELSDGRDVELLTLGGASLSTPDSVQDELDSMPRSELHDETEGVEMIYTSGTTGQPKGGRRPLPGTHPASESLKLSKLFDCFDMSQDAVYLSPGAPLYHAAPLRFCMANHRLGATTVILERFDPLQALGAIEKYSVTHSQWVPTMFVRLLRLPEVDRKRFDLSSHRVAIHGAAPCPRPIKEAMLEWWGPIVHEYYGASEGGGITHIGPIEWLDHPGSVGKPLYGIPHIVSEESGKEVLPGEAGLVYFERGMPIEYHNDEAKTRSAHGPNGWSTVGDLGYLDEGGYLYLLDRRANLIISGGVNIYPQEIEDVLILHPAVHDVAVFGISNEEFGQEVKAVVQVSEDHEASASLEAALIEYCRGVLAGYKCPRSVDFVAEIPRTESGKLFKRNLMAAYAGQDHAPGENSYP
jgi:long-chain acyl-CoA synthetase